MLNLKNKSEDVTEKNNQLQLELEMDDEVTDIINFPEKYAGTYLDVTVIKPKENELFTTEKKVMSGEQVKEFIETMNLGKNRKLSIEKSKKSTNKYAKGDHIKIPTFSDSEAENVQQIFNTTGLNSIFKCKNRENAKEKYAAPCVCKNCAIVGLVADSQKRPFVTEPLKDPREILKKRNNNEENDKRKKENDHQYCQYYFKHLSEKIRSLEERVAAQEQKAVPKEYFKKTIMKLVNHFTKTTYNGQIKLEAPIQSSPINKNKTIPRQKLIVNPILIQSRSGEEPPQSNVWKWREDILKPGIDMKNKLISVMEDTLNSLKKSKTKPKEDELKSFINEFSNNLYKTINDDKATCRKKDSHRNPVSVTYVNSQILRWQDTQTTFKFESDKESLHNLLEKKKTQEFHKYEFLKTIKNTKEEDKRRLWESIREQANKNGHNKYNKVTVQIPDKSNPKKGCVEVEYTLGELEYLLLGNRTNRR
ncbi:uncharacterized protein LOC130895567 [Diorhabda carinulata]|uniref:uncharacterized protein LOC130895567 n=1 Tax=Diorhabda carinulata TaxID=1163345 RepID=UPI0025A068C3|nr:uncharacterized protein LOC130895567 [Diorhabda carinulata]